MLVETETVAPDRAGDSGLVLVLVLVIQLKNMATTSVPDSNEKTSHKNN